jgi:demethylmenaquinone methyltransferase/2-methoxy-6-polyprenyl-1,4-benzoquinol methylase
VVSNTLETYYRERAAEYDRFYEVPQRLGDLARLRTWLVDRVGGRTILEVAAGTGHWTKVAAAGARAIVATDYNGETLAIAAQRELGPNVSLRVADAYALPDFGETFDAGMAHLWWSHIEKHRRREFLTHFAAHLQPGALLLMIDQTYVEGVTPPVVRQDDGGNQYSLRKLANGSTYEIVKNYPSDEELRENLAAVCDGVSILRLDHFWALSGNVRPSDAISP